MTDLFGQSSDEAIAEAQNFAEELWGLIAARIPPLVPGRPQGPEPGMGFLGPAQFYIAIAIVLGRLTAIDAHTRAAGPDDFLKDFMAMVRLHMPRQRTVM